MTSRPGLPLGRVLGGHVLEVLRTLPTASVHVVVSSPPFLWKRLYDVPDVDWPAVTYTPQMGLKRVRVPAWTGQLGQEPDPKLFVGHLVAVFRELARVLRPDGTAWLNLADSATSGGRGGGGSFAGIRRARTSAANKGAQAAGWRSAPVGYADKDCVLTGPMVALALQADGWVVRRPIVVQKRNCMPGSVRDAPHSSYEYMFLLARQRHYFYDEHAVLVPASPETHSRGNGTGPKTNSAPADRLGRAKNNASFSGYVRYRTTKRRLRDVWTFKVGRYTGAHYATMAPGIARTCILAGTSAAGACPTCGCPWTPMVVKARLLDGVERADLPPIRAGSAGGAGKRSNSTAQGFGHQRITIDWQLAGWKRACACPHARPVPCRVLDPFAGSGTTLLEAYALGRVGVGVDLAGGDLDLGGHTANERVAAARSHQSLEEHTAGQLTLFGPVPHSQSEV